MAETALPDPLANWTPSPAAPQSAALPDPLAPPPKKGVLDTSFNRVPTKDNPIGHLWDVPGTEEAGAPQGSMTDSLGIGRYIDTSTKPVESQVVPWGDGSDSSAPTGPYVGNILPLSRDEGGNIRLALPNMIRAPLTGLTREGPQMNDQGKLVVPGVQTDPVTGSPSLTPNAAAAGSLAMPDTLRFSTPVGPFKPPMRTIDTPSGPAQIALPSPSIADVYRGPLSTNADPVTQSAIDMLKRATRPTDIPSPPEQFSLTPGPAAAPSPPPGGLLGAPPPRVGVAPADTPILTAEDIRRATQQQGFGPADQAAARGTMLPDDTATAVRKAFSDQIPNDPEQQRITANRPTVQAANNVDPTGPMSFETAMMLDRDLTDRIRAAKGSDQHDLGQLQGNLRAQMNTVVDQSDALQGWKQYIKQSQMEDIVHDTSLRPDDKQDAYMRQRATSLASNDSAMRNWTPEEQAALATVAKSGNLSMMGRLAVGIVKPVGQAIGGGIGGYVAGPVGGLVGANIGGDIGATQAANLRRYLSQTSLDPVMRQISAGVPNIPTPPP